MSSNEAVRTSQTTLSTTSDVDKTSNPSIALRKASETSDESTESPDLEFMMKKVQEMMGRRGSTPNIEKLPVKPDETKAVASSTTTTFSEPQISVTDFPVGVTVRPPPSNTRTPIVSGAVLNPPSNAPPATSLMPGFAGRRPTRPSMAPSSSRRKGPMSLSELGIGPMQDAFKDFSNYVDPSGKLQFAGKAVLHSEGVDFTGGSSYRIKMADISILEELGKGQYGTVHRVRHEPTNVVMAMKEIKLELDTSKLNGILMELDVLHKSSSPHIVEFYGAFFVESCVFYCMEFMDAGSMDKLEAPDGVPEEVLAKITIAMLEGLRFLKDNLNIIHRDVKPTNILVNLKGEIKLCDFGVSGKLMNSMAKTNIGCQSYMAPERISFEQADTYTVASDVWSLGIAMVEMGLGKYPYPTENSVFAQLSAIVSGEPPSLPEDKFSQGCRDFIAQCLHKEPKKRPNYQQLLQHPWIVAQREKQVDMEAWAIDAHKRADERLQQQRSEQQAKEALVKQPIRMLSAPNLPTTPPETGEKKESYMGAASGLATLPRK